MERTVWWVRPIDSDLFEIYEEDFTHDFATEEEAWQWWEDQQDDGWAQDCGIYECKVVEATITNPESKEE
jgi:hypothetical protein